MVFPTAKTLLREGDMLALSGSHDAIEEATRLLTRGA
jgi:K+/H+ antiporter YhaU regulatory subunit KhtT